MSATANELDSERIADACKTVFPDPEHRSLLLSLNRLYSDKQFTVAKSLKGWYRIGGVVNAKNEKITDDLIHWAYENGENDFSGMLEYCIKSDLFATRLNGKTHYLVAPYGDSAVDYYQLEIEETQEIIARRLCGEQLPLDIEDFIDPQEPASETCLPLGPPHYRLKRVLDNGVLFGNMQESRLDKPAVLRMIHDWDNCSAASNHIFCRHWVFSLHEYTNRFDEQRFRITPLSTYESEIPQIQFNESDRGSHLASLIRRFDRHIGYPMAWYFELMRQEVMSANLVQAIIEDHEQGFAYLPNKDLKLIKDWLSNPYSI